MKNLLFSILLMICASGSLFSQIYVGDATINIIAGTVLYSVGDITNTGSAIFTNEGTLITRGDIINSGTATLIGDGQYTLEGNWTNSATFDAGTSTVTFEGATNSTVTSGGDAFNMVELSKDTANLLLADGMAIINDLHFVSDDNKVSLAGNDLTFGAAATVTSPDSNEYIITGGTGEVKKTDLGTTEFVFPVGFDANSYNPLTLVQSVSGTVDEFGVRVLENVLADGGSGLVLTEGVVDASWEVTEAIAGGSDLTLTAQWVGSDELTGFDRTDSGISRYDGVGWDLTNADAGAAAGADPYTRTRSSVADVGFFAVGGVDLMDYVAVTSKAFLQGPYHSGTGLMNDDLRTNVPVLIPVIEPYTALSNFTHVGRGGGETVDPAVFLPTGNDAIVDWVFIELRDKNAPATVLQTKSALIQRDGDIVDLDGVSEVRFVGMGGDDYYFALQHRNHLGVMSANAFTLSRAQTSIDFTSISTYGTNAQIDLGGGVMGMWTGDIDHTGVIDAADRSGVWNNRNLLIYVGSDTTLDGITDAADRSVVWNNRNLIAQLPD
ncbi:MAG: hypothetical protein K9I85_13610 [Saprospiraceae bacterium]|nr:hypothetical protein [Saprospiraceae bacterium]